MKIKNDKYYTPEWLVKHTINKAKEIIGEENITQFLEPSAGDGRFLDLLPPDTLAYDLYPERDDITKQDYLKLSLDYKEGRCVIGNPPYGRSMILARAFCSKSFEVAEYVSFILPASQHNNTQSIYGYDLIYSELLGMVEFSGSHEVNVCLNIYKRPKNGRHKSKTNYKKLASPYITMVENRVRPSEKETKIYKDFDYDIALCSYGQAGKICGPLEYNNVLLIKIIDEDNKKEILKALETVDWYSLYNMNGAALLRHWQVYKYIYELMNSQ